MAAGLAERVDPDHRKVLATAEAIAGRAAAGDQYHPTVVFVERTATLEQLRKRVKHAAPGAEVEIVSGDQHPEARKELLQRFNGQARPSLQVLLASKVAEMGLDIDGPEQKEDIWLIHHDFPWNPAMVDQRNGRVCRPAKSASAAPVSVTYPFLRDTVDERIFKRMLMRQSLAELLLGTDDVARALRLGDHDSLEGLTLERVAAPELRELTPDLSPRRATPAPPARGKEQPPPVELPSAAPPVAKPEAPPDPEALPVLPEATASQGAQAPSTTSSASETSSEPATSAAPATLRIEVPLAGRNLEEPAPTSGVLSVRGLVRPPWCPLELVEAAESRSAAALLFAPEVVGVIASVTDDLCVARFDLHGVAYLRMELGSRRQAVALVLRKASHGERILEVLSLADPSAGTREKLRDAFRLNALPGAAGLVIVPGSGCADRLFARAANLADTLQETELRRMIDDAAKLADDWEAHFYGNADQW